MSVEPKKHAGDCSIYEASSEICDCGAFRHNIKVRRVPTAEDNVTWNKHLHAIDRSINSYAELAQLEASLKEWRALAGKLYRALDSESDDFDLVMEACDEYEALEAREKEGG